MKGGVECPRKAYSTGAWPRPTGRGLGMCAHEKLLKGTAFLQFSGKQDIKENEQSQTYVAVDSHPGLTRETF